MKRSIFVFPLVILALAALACQAAIPDLPSLPNTVRGSGTVSTETRDVNGFTSVSLEGMGDVYITVGSTESLTIEAEDNLLPLLTSNVEGGTLKLGIEWNKNIDPTKPIVYTLTVKDLKSVTLAGSGNFYIAPLKSDAMTLMLAGSGDINLDELETGRFSVTIAGSGNITVDQLTADSVESDILGSGDIRLAGEAPEQSLDVMGSGSYLTGDLRTATTRITIAGSGDVTVWVTDELTTVVNGSGDVKYYGQPSVSQSGLGSGTLTSLGDK